MRGALASVLATVFVGVGLLSPVQTRADDVVRITVLNDSNHQVEIGTCYFECDSMFNLYLLYPGKSKTEFIDADSVVAIVDTQHEKPFSCIKPNGPGPYRARVSQSSIPQCTITRATSTTPGWLIALFITAWCAIVLAVWTMCIVGAVRVFNRRRARGWRDIPAVLFAMLACLGLIMGGWLGYIPYLIYKWIRKKMRKNPPAAVAA